MFETIIWFVFRDSRVDIPLIKKRPEWFLIIWFICTLPLVLYIFIEFFKIAKNYYPGYLVLHIKIYLELICTLGSLPYLIFKGFKTVDLNSLEGSDKYLIENFLKSWTLETGLFTIPGMIYGLTGFYNLFWAIYYASNYSSWPTHTFTFILLFFAVVDLIALVFILVFTAYVGYYKL